MTSQNCPNRLDMEVLVHLGVGKNRVHNVGGANEVLGLHEGGVGTTYKSVG